MQDSEARGGKPEAEGQEAWAGGAPAAPAERMREARARGGGAPRAVRNAGRLRRVARVFARAGAILIVVLAVAIVSTLTIDLGPALRREAERAGSNQIKRPIHIGKLSVRLFQGRFVIDDLIIEGLKPTDRPFLRARRVELSMPWSTLINREVVFQEVVMTDWDMTVEQFRGGGHNFPRFVRGGPRGQRRFTTTVRYVRASGGEFTYLDHGTPWSVVARKLEVRIAKLVDYRGEAWFSGGTVAIQDYVPLATDMRTRFHIQGGKVLLDRIDLTTDGSKSLVTGEVDFSRWPEQIYHVRSHVDFPRMKEKFFARDSFRVSGEGDFRGTFHLFKGGRELKGDFTSPLAGFNDYRFPSLRGSLVWLPDRFVIDHARADFSGGTAAFDFSMMPFGRPTRATARFNVAYENVDLATFTDFLETRGLRLAGRASGKNDMEWTLGRFSERRAEGVVAISPPPGARTLGRVPPAELGVESDDERYGVEWGPFSGHTPPGYVPMGGRIPYRFGPGGIELGPSTVSTAKTYVEFQGYTDYGRRSRIPFHVTSADWQESDRLLAGVITAFGSPTSAVPVGGRGEFDGVMLGDFNRPRIEGRFRGAAMRAWDVVWGDGEAEIVIENNYVEVARSSLRRTGSEILASGKFSLGYPRRDRADEIDARVTLRGREVADLRRAFGLDDYDLDGKISGDFRLSGKYETPFGFGKMTITNGVAYGEPFETAEATLRFEGNGVRLEGATVHKRTGTITGAAFIGWNGTYAFNADGRQLSVESLRVAAFERAPLSGLLEFSASGSGTFDSPQYTVRLRVRDLFAGEEGVGDVVATLGVRGQVMTVELEAASPRLAVSGTGRIALTPEADAEVTLRFTDTSLDPYVRMFQAKLSPFTTAVVSGSLRAVGELSNIDQLLVEGTVDQLVLKLFDYPASNEGPIKLALDRHAVRIDQMRLVGQGTELDVGGTVNLHDRRIGVKATGSANLGILQGFFRDIRSAGQAELQASLEGPIDAPLLSGSASITGGRLRHFSLPHSIEAINGRVSFDRRALRLEDVTARVGGGDVTFGGRITLEGYTPGELNLTATGENMRLRYPEGVRSVVDADLALSGRLEMPVLSGTVTVKSAEWSRRIDTSGNILNLAGGGDTSAPAAAGQTLPLRFDVRVLAPSTLRIKNNAADITSSADLTLRGTYDRPVLTGRADIERGTVLFEGRRYIVTRGVIDFNNPQRLDPFFDVEAETRVRVPGQTYRVILHGAGTRQRLNFDLSSDPPLPQVEIVSLLFGGPVVDSNTVQDAELRTLRAQQTTEQLLQARAARLLASPISSEVERVVEQTFGVDTFQLTPGFDTLQQSSRLNPTARLTIGKRVSDRVYLTYSRSLSASTRDQIILLEYDQSDRLSWILTRNEDETYSLDMRVRHVF